jgi:protein involved in polysaccharide export with SLBB domain
MQSGQTEFGKVIMTIVLPALHKTSVLVFRISCSGLFLFALITCVLFGSGRGQQPGTENRQETDLIHFGDLIDVDVIGSLEFDWRGSINPEGFLDGIETLEEPVFALCRSESEITADLITGFSKILREPKINVKVIDRSRRAEAVLGGAVRFPTRFQVRRPVKLNELIILAGGITDNTSGNIVIFRPESLSCAGRSVGSSKATSESFVMASQPSGARSISVTIADLLTGKENPAILSGDIVTVVEAQPIYVIGGVNNPRQLSSRSQLTVSRAIDAAGGLTKDADASSVNVFRRMSSGTETIKVDITRIRAKQADDIILKPYDIVDVTQKGRGPRRFPPHVETDSARMDRANLRLRIIE